MIDGEWRPEGLSVDDSGYFRRNETTFRDWIEEDAVAGRYRLYVSWACPWAHRTLIARALYGLEEVISLSAVHSFMGDDGWTFEDGPGVIPDPGGAHALHEVYARAKSDYTGRVTVPVLLDEKEGRIVNNESREIVRILSDAFRRHHRDGAPDLHPARLHDEIERVADAIYSPINNGVYRAGFARSQEAYDEAVAELFEALEHWDRVLGEQRYVAGDQLTEADVFLFTTLVRFDRVYHVHFKCSRKRIVDYPNLWAFTRELHQNPAIRETVDLDYIAAHYYRSHPSVNPHRIVAAPPALDWDEPHGRG